MASFLPFLSKLLPAGLALKGLSKIDPRISNFFAGAELAGYGTDQILDFLRDKYENPVEKGNEQQLKQRASQGNIRADERENLRNIEGQKSSSLPIAAKILGGIGGIASAHNGNEGSISQSSPQQNQSDPLQFLSGYSPELTQFIQDQLQKGQPAKSIAALAKQDQKLAQVVSKIEKDTNKDFISLLEEILGGQSFQQQSPINQPSSQGGMTGIQGVTSMRDLMGQGTQGGQVPGQSQSANRLAQVLAQYAQIRGKR